MGEIGSFGAASVGTIVVLVAKYLIDLYSKHRKDNRDDEKQRADLVGAERRDLLQAQVQLRQELMAEILVLRKQVLDLQELNTKYVSENASMRTRISELEKDNEEQRAQIKELHSELAELRSTTRHS